MRISYVSMLYPSEAFAVTDVRALVTAGHQVAVHSLRCRDRRTNVYSTDVLQGTKLSYADGKTAVLFPYLALRYFTTFLWIVGIVLWKCQGHRLRSLALIPRALQIAHDIKQQRAEILHLFWGHYPSLVALIVKRVAPNIRQSMFLGAYDLTMRYALSAVAAAGADALFTHARCNEQDIRRTVPAATQIHFVHRGIDTSIVDVVPSIEAKRDMISVVARLIPDKGVEESISAFAKIACRFPSYRLVIVGEGPAQRKLMRLATELRVIDRVSFAGVIPHREVMDQLLLSKVLLLMSYSDSERLPNVVKEGMLAGNFCVATATPGIGELMQTAGTQVVEVHDVSAAAKSIERFLKLPSEVQAQMVTENHRFIKEHFDVSQQMRKYEGIWQQCLAGR